MSAKIDTKVSEISQEIKISQRKKEGPKSILKNTEVTLGAKETKENTGVRLGAEKTIKFDKKKPPSNLEKDVVTRRLRFFSEEFIKEMAEKDRESIERYLESIGLNGKGNSESSEGPSKLQKQISGSAKKIVQGIGKSVKPFREKLELFIKQAEEIAGVNGFNQRPHPDIDSVFKRKQKKPKTPGEFKEDCELLNQVLKHHNKTPSNLVDLRLTNKPAIGVRCLVTSRDADPDFLTDLLIALKTIGVKIVERVENGKPVGLEFCLGREMMKEVARDFSRDKRLEFLLNSSDRGDETKKTTNKVVGSHGSIVEPNQGLPEKVKEIVGAKMKGVTEEQGAGKDNSFLPSDIPTTKPTNKIKEIG